MNNTTIRDSRVLHPDMVCYAATRLLIANRLGSDDITGSGTVPQSSANPVTKHGSSSFPGVLL